MAAQVMSPLAQGLSGVAFEVQIKSPGRECRMTPARQRLEAYGTYGMGPLPCLLHSREARHPPVECHGAQEKAEKARRQNQLARETAAKAKAELDRLAAQKRLELEQDMKSAGEKREGTLAHISARARKHFEAARARCDATRLLRSADATARRKALEEAQLQKGTIRCDGLAERSARAGQHNDSVAERLRRGPMCGLKEAARLEELRQMVAAQARAAAKREAAFAARGERAGRHFVEVMEKSEACQLRRARSAAHLSNRLKEDQKHHLAVHEAGVARIRARAGEHNVAVAVKVRQHSEREADAATTASSVSSAAAQD